MNPAIRLLFLLTATSLVACGSSERSVTVYVSHDRNLSEPVLQAFEQKTGIRVDAVYDTEANKTTGLVNRLLAEQSQPQADVFWNNEVGRTLQLKERGVLVASSTVQPDPVSAPYTDKDQVWFGFAGRGRVLVVNAEQVAEAEQPQGLGDLSDPRWRGRAAIANPHFGTTGTHFAALYAQWGEARFRAWLRVLRANKVAMLPGNAQVRDKVASGEYAFGLTDTDDVNGAFLDGKPVRLVIPDQRPNGLGVFVIPNTVAQVNAAPHPVQAQQLLEYLLSPEVETQLAAGRGAQIPLRSKVPGPTLFPPMEQLRLMPVDYAQIATAFEPMLRVFQEEWPR